MESKQMYDIKNAIGNVMLGCAAALIMVFLPACSRVFTKTELLEVDVPAGEADPVAEIDHRQGTAVAVWEEPMVDVVDVPPGLDPEGHYYRPAHSAVVEIRQGKWQYYRRTGEGK